jgi:hypothetical protein
VEAAAAVRPATAEAPEPAAADVAEDTDTPELTDGLADASLDLAPVEAVVANGLWLVPGGSAAVSSQALAAIESRVGRSFATEEPANPELVLVVGREAFLDAARTWPDTKIVALDVSESTLASAAHAHVAAVPTAPDPAELVTRLRTLIPSLKKIGGVHRGETDWWRALKQACAAQSIELVSKATTAQHVGNSIDNLTVKTEVLVIQPDAALWTEDSLTSLFGTARAQRGDEHFPVVSWTTLHLSGPTSATMAIEADSGAKAAAAGELALAQLQGTEIVQQWPGLWLTGHSIRDFHAAAGVSLTRTSQGTVDDWQKRN